MLRAFHRLGKALPGTWQAGLFPSCIAEQTLNRNGVSSGNDGETTSPHAFGRAGKADPLRSTPTAASWLLQDLGKRSRAGRSLKICLL